MGRQDKLLISFLLCWSEGWRRTGYIPLEYGHEYVQYVGDTSISVKLSRRISSGVFCNFGCVLQFLVCFVCFYVIVFLVMVPGFCSPINDLMLCVYIHK